MKALGFKPKYEIQNFLTKEGNDNIIDLFNGETV